MIVLGINQVPGMIGWLHDSAAAVVKDGEIIATAEEERFNRIRHARGNPKYAIDFCLKEAGITLSDVDVIAIAHNPWAPFTKFRFSLRLTNLLTDVINLVIFLWYKRYLSTQTNAKVVFVDHHLAHAASAYYCSGYETANVMTIDGSGETESFAFFIGKNGTLNRQWDIPFGDKFSKKKWRSIGGVYSRVTSHIGLGVQAEGKTMGLASYGKPTYDFSNILNIQSHNKYVIDRRRIAELYPELERSDSKSELTQEHKNLAASLQHALEESILNLAKEAHLHTGYRDFAFAGGVALNCNTNSRVLLSDFCDRLFVQPASNDGGISLGAALELSARVGDKPMHRLTHAYYGPGFTNDDIEKLLKNAKLDYVYHENVEAEAARLITSGAIVSWFQGRMEMGPRALGNRSILADPTKQGMDDKINQEVKHREVWRPFAPSVAEEDAATFFEGVDKASESPFMLHTFYVKEQYREKLPSITHVDGSSRIQTVRSDQNERYYNLLKEIEKINGYPIVLNTSFNDKGEPIVCTPQDAVKCFYSTGIDHLVIGNFVLSKPVRSG